jgi:hypothetical protein
MTRELSSLNAKVITPPPPPPPPHILTSLGLSVVGIAPSSATESSNAAQRDDAYYSPTSNFFVVEAHLFAYQDLPESVRDLNVESKTRLLDAMRGSLAQSHGLFSQSARLFENSMSSVLGPLLVQLFFAYCEKVQALSSGSDVSILSEFSIQDPGAENQGLWIW